MTHRVREQQASITQMLYAAEAARMRSLLDAWDKEIKAGFEALAEEAKKIHAQKGQATAEAQRKVAQEAADAALDQSLGVLLEGLLIRAEANDTSAISIPTGLRSASGLSAPGLGALLGQIQEEILEGAEDPVTQRARKSAGFSLENALIPHPADLAILLDRAGVDPLWSETFKLQGAALDRLAAEPTTKIPQLAVHQGHERLEVLKAVVDDLGRFRQGSGAERDRLIDLVAQPSQIRGTTALTLPGKATGPGTVRTLDLARVLDQLGFSASLKKS